MLELWVDIGPTYSTTLLYSKEAKYEMQNNDMKRLIMYSRTCFIMIMNAMCHSLFWKKKKSLETEVGYYTGIL